jgi:DNA-binding transcriptional LysR family regulator
MTVTALTSQILNNVSVLSLRCFVAVIETQSFSSAARQLRVAPSSVTKHVQQIESAVGAALVHRTTRRTNITAAGERFYEQCLAILGHIDTACADIGAEKNLSGHLRVTSPPSFAAAFLGPHLHEFLREQPALSIDVNVTSATEDLVRNRIDVAITLREEPQSKLTHFWLGSVGLTLCASPDYLARMGAPESPEDLMRHECLTGRYSDLATGWNMGRDGVWQVVNPNFRLLSDNGELLQQASVRGAGIGTFYHFHIQDDLREGRLVRVLPQYEMSSRNLYAVIPHRNIVRPQARVFIEFVRRLVATSTSVTDGIMQRSSRPEMRLSPRNVSIETKGL